jgi:hypothetical protein
MGYPGYQLVREKQDAGDIGGMVDLVQNSRRSRHGSSSALDSKLDHPF